MHEFRVEKMSCGGCARRVTQAVQAVDRDARIDVDLAAKTVRVESSAAADVMAAAITRAGYPAASLSTT